MFSIQQNPQQKQFVNYCGLKSNRDCLKKRNDAKKIQRNDHLRHAVLF